MKAGIGDIVGKTISGVVIAQNSVKPNQQVFLTFSDGTYFEFWGESFSCAGGISRGSVAEASTYAQHALWEQKSRKCIQKVPVPNPAFKRDLAKKTALVQ